MKRIISIAVFLLFALTITSGCAIKEKEAKTTENTKSIGFYKNYDEATQSVSEKSDEFKVNEQVHSQIINNKEFGATAIGLTIYSVSSGVRKVVGGTSVRIKESDKKAVLSFIIATAGDYEIVVYTDQSGKELITGKLRII